MEGANCQIGMIFDHTTDSTGFIDETFIKGKLYLPKKNIRGIEW